MRERVIGIETEYALIYHPGRGERHPPQNLTLYARFESALRHRVHSLPNAFSPLRAKLGRFLENGGTFHYEATVEDYEHGLIEMASPECRDPLTLLGYERAKDELLEELAEEVNRELAHTGHSGRVRIGKNNVDTQQHSFGSHENYWVEDRLSAPAWALFALLFVPLWTLSAPVVAGVIVLQLVLLATLFCVVLTLVLSIAMLPLVPAAWARRLRRTLWRWHEFLQAEHIEIARRLQPLLLPLHALIALHSVVYNVFHFRALREHMTAFLATRAVYAGAGAVAFDGGPLLRISQRAPFIDEISRICVDGRRRPIFETRDLFFRPWSALCRRRRLQLMLGDANLCEWALLLRIGATCLVIEAIESKRPFAWPKLRDPLSALGAVSEDVGLSRELELADGSHATALAIQRRYLEGVRALLPEAELERGWKRRVIDAWSRTLELLERDPDALADRIDWIAKRALVRAVVSDARDWRALEERGAALLAASGPLGAEDERLRALAYRAWRADLRYHELSKRGGYQRLERTGRTLRISQPAQVAQARRTPPSDTRACARGEAIRFACEQALSGGAAWHRVRLGKFDWRFFHDPLDPGRADRRSDLV
jgi:Pup amidohydrolase